MATRTADVAIIGAGAIGSALARELAGAGLQVVVVEKDHPGSGASAAAAGILSPQAEADAPGPLLDLGLESRALFPDLLDALMEETGTEVPYRTSGTLSVALSREDEDRLEARFAWQLGAGLPVERLSSGRLTTLEPALSPSVRLGLRFPYDHQIDNASFTRALAAAAQRRGAEILSGVEARAVLAAGGRVAGLETGGERIASARVVVCAGAWSGLLDTAGPRIPVMPVRGQIVALESDEVRLDRVLYSDGAYLVPRLDGRILAGSTVELAGFEMHNTAEGAQRILSVAQSMVPRLGEARISGMWSGLRPGTPDGLPVLGPAGSPWPDGLWFATGHYRNGILLAPITARLISEGIVSGRTSTPLDPFLPARFATGPIEPRLH